jgi:putative endonuclease
MHYVYILYSSKLDKYYIGETIDLEERLHLHNSGYFKKAFTSKAKDWEIKLTLTCSSIIIARKIEAHIKKMKSRIFTEKLMASSGLQNHIVSKFENP